MGLRDHLSTRHFGMKPFEPDAFKDAKNKVHPPSAAIATPNLQVVASSLTT